MSERYRLGGIANDWLLASLRVLVRRQNDLLSDLLAHLAELDERELCLELGYSSLFAYCVEVLGFSKSSAGRHIAAARVCRKYPEAFARVAKGELKLSVLLELNKYLSSGNAAELFAACSGKSYEQVELLLAARFPKPDVRDWVRRLPNRTVVTPDIGCSPVSSASSTALPARVEATLGNLRLRCGAHNLHAARVYFGAKFMRASLRRVRVASRCGARNDRAARRMTCRPGHTD